MFNSNNLSQVNTTKSYTMHKQQKTKLETEIEPSNAAFNNNQQNKKQVFGPQISFNPDNQIKINRVFKKRIQYDCKPYDSKSDIWSLGCVIYEMATLKPPFRAEDMDGLYKKVVKGQYSKIGNGFSEALSNVIKSMLQVNPASRPNAKQLLRSLASKA